MWGTRLRPLGRLASVALALSGLAVSGQLAEVKRNPTFSLEATAINNQPIVGGPVSELNASPGDIITVEIYLRDWSPGGEKLRAYQASLDDVSYNSGSAGSVKPADYDETTAKLKENPTNAFILDDHPRYLFAHTRNRLPIVDTITPGYRWLNVLVNPQEARICAQDGKKHYVGTAKMKVSDDAAGTFTVRLLEDASSSMLRDNTDENNAILPLDFERLTVHVTAEAGGLRVVSTDPPLGANNPALGTGAAAWDRVKLTFNGPAGTVKAEDLEVRDGTSDPPKIKQLIHEDSTVTVVLDRPIQAGRSTTVTHKASGSGAALSNVPGDVNDDGVTDALDVLAIIERSRPEGVGPLYAYDVNGDGKLQAVDAVLVVDIAAKSRRTRQDKN